MSKKQYTLRTQYLPHTPAWFAQFEAINPTQAAITAVHVLRTGRLDVCGICGEIGAPIYRLTEPPFMLVRLCDDCWIYQTVLYDLRVAPYSHDERRTHHGT